MSLRLRSLRLRRPCSGGLAAIALAISAIFPGVGSAALPVFGGPTYDSVTNTGAKIHWLMHNPGATAGNGVGLTYVELENGTGPYLGDRAYRWTPTGSPLRLGTIGTDSFGFTLTLAYAINQSNVAVGAARKFSGDTSLGFRAVRWNAAGVATELGALSGSANGNAEAVALAVNAGGTAVGYGYKPAGSGDQGFRAVRWNAGTTAAIELAPLGTDNSGYGEAQANAVNSSGTAVGYSRKYVGGALRGIRAVRWSAGGIVATELGNLGTSPSGAANNIAIAVNDAGTAVGFAYKFVAGAPLGQRAVRWEAGSTVATELKPLNTDSAGFTTSEAHDINSAGMVVGYATRYSASGVDLGNRAVRWSPGSTTAVELGTLGVDSNGFSDNDAFAVNSSGVAVGHARHPTLLDYHAVVWGADGVAIDLNKLIAPNSGWTLYEAADVTDTGWITATGSYDPDGSGPRSAYTRSCLMLVPAAGTYGNGDADFDTRIGFSDLVVLAQNYGKSNGSLATTVADFDLSGATNFEDLVRLAQHYQPTSALVAAVGGDQFASDWALAQALVPEPGSAAVTLAGGLLCRRRRR